MLQCHELPYNGRNILLRINQPLRNQGHYLLVDKGKNRYIGNVFHLGKQ